MKEKCHRCGGKLKEDALEFRNYSISGECDREYRKSKAEIDIRIAEIKQRKK